MMLMVMPVSCMTTRAVMIESGMLMAATMVDRTLSRNAKIVRIANRAPRPPSRTSPSRDSMMKVDRSLTVVIESLSACRSPISASFAWTSAATSTVLAAEVFETVRLSEGLPFVRPKPVVAMASILTVPRSPRVIGSGRAGATDGAGETFGSVATGGTTVAGWV